MRKEFLFLNMMRIENALIENGIQSDQRSPVEVETNSYKFARGFSCPSW